MNGRFWREVAIALLLSAAAAILYPWLRWLLGGADALRLALLVAATGYVICRVLLASGRSGRLLASAAWLVLATALLVFNPGLAAWLLLPTLYLWLLRALLCHGRPMPALADAALTALALGGALLAAAHTHSLFLALWSYFLVQGLHVLLPQTTPTPSAAIDPFAAATRQAEAALRRLSAGH